MEALGCSTPGPSTQHHQQRQYHSEDYANYHGVGRDLLSQSSDVCYFVRGKDKRRVDTFRPCEYTIKTQTSLAQKLLNRLIRLT